MHLQASDQALYKLKQDQEDLGDQHLLQSVASELGDANEGEDDSLAAVSSLLIHVCAENRSVEESESDILVSMEEGERTLRVYPWVMLNQINGYWMIGAEDSLSHFDFFSCRCQYIGNPFILVRFFLRINGMTHDNDKILNPCGQETLQVPWKPENRCAS